MSGSPPADLSRLRIDRDRAPRRAAGRSWFGTLVKLLFLAAVIGAGWAFRESIERKFREVSRPTVQVTLVEKDDPAALIGAVKGIAANGYVVAARRAALSTDIAGRVTELRVTEGSVVKKGDVVARLFDAEFLAAVTQSKADLVSAEAQLARSRTALAAAEADVAQTESNELAAVEAVKSDEADLAFARQSFERARKGLAVDVATPEEFDRAKSTLNATEARLRRSKALLAAAKVATMASRARVKVSEADVTVAQAAITVSKASLEQSEARLTKTEVRAPFDGVVVLKDAEIGEVVTPNAGGGANARGSVVTMVDFGSLEVQADVPETSLSAVRIGGRTRIFLDASPQTPYEGEVARIWPTADRQKATVEVRVKFDKPDERLRPEMGVRIVFLPEDAEPAATDSGPTEKTEPKIRIDRRSLARIDERTGVFVLVGTQVQFVPVEVGDDSGARVIITSGLEGGERIILAPPAGLRDGDSVRLQEDS